MQQSHNSDRKEKRKQDIEEYLVKVESESLKDALLRKGSGAADRRKLSGILFKLCKLDDKEFTKHFVALIAEKIDKAPEETQGLLQEFQKRFIGHGLATSKSQGEAINAIRDIIALMGGDVFEELMLIPQGCPYIAGVADGALIAKNEQSEIVLVLIEFEGKEKSRQRVLIREERYGTLTDKYIEISGSLIKIDCVELVLGGEAEQLKKDVLHMLSQKKLIPLSKGEIEEIIKGAKATEGASSPKSLLSPSPQISEQNLLERRLLAELLKPDESQSEPNSAPPHPKAFSFDPSAAPFFPQESLALQKT